TPPTTCCTPRTCHSRTRLSPWTEPLPNPTLNPGTAGTPPCPRPPVPSTRTRTTTPRNRRSQTRSRGAPPLDDAKQYQGDRSVCRRYVVVYDVGHRERVVARQAIHQAIHAVLS